MESKVALSEIKKKKKSWLLLYGLVQCTMSDLHLLPPSFPLYLPLSSCVYVYMWAHRCPSAQVEVRRQLVGGGSFLLPSRSWALNSGPQTQWQTPYLWLDP